MLLARDSIVQDYQRIKVISYTGFMYMYWRESLQDCEERAVMCHANMNATREVRAFLTFAL